MVRKLTNSLPIPGAGINVPVLDSASRANTKPADLGANIDWRTWAQQPQTPKNRAALVEALPTLLSQTGNVTGQNAHMAVHAVVMSLAAGQAKRTGAGFQSLTTDRVHQAITEVDEAISGLEAQSIHVDYDFKASFDRMKTLAQRTLDHNSPIGFLGPLSVYGPMDDHPMNPSSLYPNFAHRNTVLEGLDAMSPMSLLSKQNLPYNQSNAQAIKRTGEHHFEFLPGQLLAFAGPGSPLYWMLGAAGHLGPTAFQRGVQGGAWKDEFGTVEVVKTKNADGSVQTTPLNELYSEMHAQQNNSPDAFFGVEGSAAQGDTDAYRFTSKHDQWVTLTASQVTPGRRFAVELYRLEGKQRTLVDRSEGIAGPAGIHSRVPKGQYEAVVSQLPPDEHKPEITEHPVGKRLFPALNEFRKAFADLYPEQVDAQSEADPNRYRVMISGTGPIDDQHFGPTEGADLLQAKLSSRTQENTLAQSVAVMESALNFADLFGGYHFFVPLEPKPAQNQDPMIERFMSATKRLNPVLFGVGAQKPWLATLIRNSKAPMEMWRNIAGLLGAESIEPQTRAPQ